MARVLMVWLMSDVELTRLEVLRDLDQSRSGPRRRDQRDARLFKVG